MNAKETTIYNAGNRTINFLEATESKAAVDSLNKIKRFIVIPKQ
jgi:hypothetical protein